MPTARGSFCSCKPIEDDVLAVDLLVVNLASQNGPQPLVCRFRPLQLLLLAEDFVEHVLGRATKRADRVNTPDTGHSLLAVLLALLQSRRLGAGAVVDRLRARRINPTHGHALAVAAGDQNLLLRGWVDGLLFVEVDLGMVGRSGHHVLQAVD